MKERFDITWLDPIHLTLADDQSKESLVKRLRAQIKDGAADYQMKSSVYIVRMAGSFIIDYENCPSPVVYIGRGDSVSRLASHLKNWASDVFKWGSDTKIEIRLLRPSRKNREDYFKNVEADLIRWFSEKTGMLPLINARFETSWEGHVDYGPSQEKLLLQSLGIGKGVRHKWAIRPMPSNKVYAKYHR